MIDEGKVPYDNEPITRHQTQQMVKESKRGKKKVSKGMTFVLALLFVVNCITVGSVVAVSARLNKLTEISPTYNISADGELVDLALGSAKGMLSTVSIFASISSTCADASDFFAKKYEGHKYSRGSGVVMQIDKTLGNAYIITNAHVIYNSESSSKFPYVWIMLWDSLVPVKVKEVVGFSITYDIAVLYVEASQEITKTASMPVQVVDSATIVAGQPCIAIGNSRGRNLRVTSGVVSVEEDVCATPTDDDAFLISHDAPINAGNSGGGLYDAQGRLIGINTLKFDTSYSAIVKNEEVVVGMNYAIPASIAYSVAKNIIDHGELRRANIGLVYGTNYKILNKSVSITQENFIQTQYTLVVDERSGNFLEGDVLKKLVYEQNGEKVEVEINRLFAIRNHIFNLRAGDSVTVEVERGNSTVEVVVSNLTTKAVY